jgi:branched-chain amino acid transport system substrate-binding protein
VFSRVTWVPNDPRPESQKFLAGFRRLWNDEPEFHCAGGYSVGQVMHQAVEKVGGTDQKKLREAILSMEFDTIIGKLKYGEDGLPVATFPLAQWQNGKAELVFPDASMTSKAKFD